MAGKQTSVDSDNGGQCVAVFIDGGEIHLLFDAAFTSAQNKQLSAAVVAEGRSRLKVGKSDAVHVRERQAGDIVEGQLSRAS